MPARLIDTSFAADAAPTSASYPIGRAPAEHGSALHCLRGRVGRWLADPAQRDVIRVVPGRDANAVERFAVDVMGHNGDPDRVAPVTCDMGPGFAKGIREHPPNAARVIDEFHVIKHANEAVDKVRKTQAGRNPLLRRTKYPWLRNEEGLTGLQLETQA